MRSSLLFTLFILTLSSAAYADGVGSLRGSLVFDDKTTPSSLTISATRIRAGYFTIDSPDNKHLNLQGGGFTVEDLPEGRYSLSVFGDEFLTWSREEVVIEANKETDLGTILVAHGKVLRGVVLSEAGAPVSGATVVVEESLFVYTKQRPLSDRAALTGPDGSFSLRALPGAPLVLWATHETLGDSPFVALGEQQEEVSVSLSVGGLVSGAISYGGGASTATVSAISLADGGRLRAQIFCRTDMGRYSLQLPPGEYLLVATLSKDKTEAIYMPSKSQRITVEAASKRTVDLEIPVGVAVRITPPKGLSKRADWASFYLLQGATEPRDAASLVALESQLTPEELRRTSMHLSDTEALLEDVLPGRYLLCGFTTRAGLGDSAVQCQPLTIKGPAEQRVSMRKLSAPASK